MMKTLSLFALIGTTLSFSVNAEQAGDRVTYREEAIYVEHVSDMSNKRAQFTYNVLRMISDDPELSKSHTGPSLDQFREQRAKALSNIKKYHLKICNFIVAQDTDITTQVNSIFESLKDLGAYEEEQKRLALFNLDQELLNMVGEFKGSKGSLYTPKSILNNNPHDWVNVRKQGCHELMLQEAAL